MERMIVILIILLVLSSSFAAGMWSMFMTPGPFIKGSSSGTGASGTGASGTGASGTGISSTGTSVLGQSCASRECESPLQCDETTMTCIQPAPIDCVGGWSAEWSSCELTDPSDECATTGVQTKTYSITKNAEHGGNPCEKTHGQKLTKPCHARDLNQLPRKCHPDAIYDCQGHYKDKDEHCRSLYEQYPDACGTGFMTRLPYIITKEEVSEVEKPDGKGFRTNVGLCPLRNTFIDTSCSGTQYC